MHNIAMIFLHVIMWLYGSIIELHFMINILWKHHLNFLLVTNRSGDNLPSGKKKKMVLGMFQWLNSIFQIFDYGVVYIELLLLF